MDERGGFCILSLYVPLFMNLAHFPHSIGVISAVEYNTVANLLPGRPVQSHKYSWRILPFFPFVTGSHLLNCGVLFKSRGQICDWVDHTENQVFSVRPLLCSSIQHWSQRDYTSLPSCRFFITEETHFLVILHLSFYVKCGPSEVDVSFWYWWRWLIHFHV